MQGNVQNTKMHYVVVGFATVKRGGTCNIH